MQPRDAPQVLVHFYRASVMHADVWRQRLDATTNWAVVTTAAIITFAFGGRESAPFVLLLALLFDTFFLVMESRRYQSYNLWQRRIRYLHQFLVAPALRGDPEVSTERIQDGLNALAVDLGRNLPAMPLWAAMGYRIRRNYGPLVTLVIVTWLLKLYVHPDVAASWSDFVFRAHMGPLPGSWVLLGVALFFGLYIGLAVKAPSERMRDWSDVPAPIERILPDSLLGKARREEGGGKRGGRGESPA